MQTERMFRRALRAIGPVRQTDVIGGRWVLAPVSRDYPQSGSARVRGRQSAAERRRRNLTWLAGFIVATFLLGLIRPLRPLLVVNLVADVLLIAYLGAALWFAARTTPSAAAARRRATDEEDDDALPPEAAGGRF